MIDLANMLATQWVKPWLLFAA